MIAAALRRFGLPVLYGAAFALLPVLAIAHDVITGFGSATDWLSGVCVLGAGSATVTMLHAVIGPH